MSFRTDPMPQLELEHIGFNIWWTGWKDIPHQFIRVGQWVAWNGKFGAYATVPGYITSWIRNIRLCINLDMGDGNDPYIFGSYEEAQAAIDKGRRLILGLLDGELSTDGSSLADMLGFGEPKDLAWEKQVWNTFGNSPVVAKLRDSIFASSPFLTKLRDSKTSSFSGGSIVKPFRYRH